MGHGPSTSSNSMKTRTRTNSFVNAHPDPEQSIASISIQHEPMEEMPKTLRSKSYLNYRRSTASLSKLFQKQRWKKRRGSISASFNINENDIKVELMNVNTANEEELMTLHGVNREMARNIISHRELIGGFRKIEDLALVSGMGASKLDQIRPEICITRRKPGLSRASSKVPSLESIPSSTAESTRMGGSSSSRFMKFTNVNNASMFDLMSVEGINQATAARIINSREKKGPYKCVDDLRRVGISRRLLSTIKMNLTTEDFDMSDLSSTVSSNSPVRTPRHPDGHNVGSLFMSGDLPNSSTIEAFSTVPPPEPDSNDESDTLLQEIYDLMSLRTKRPHIDSEFIFFHNEYPAYRVATWNLERLTLEKISNPGVLEVIIRTILENKFSILAVQEVCEKTALEKICNEMNNPQLYCNRKWTGYRGVWKYALHESVMNFDKTTHYLGILYDSQRIEEVSIPEIKDLCPLQNGCLWQFATFKVTVRDSSWVLINLLSKALESGKYMNGNASNQQNAMEAVMSLMEGTQGAMIIGCYNGRQALKGLKGIEELKLIHPSVEDKDADVISGSICVSKGLKKSLTDDKGIIESGLTHPAIPNGWSWGGRISKSGPLWCTIYDCNDAKDSSEDEQKQFENVDDSDDYVPAR